MRPIGGFVSFGTFALDPKWTAEVHYAESLVPAYTSLAGTAYPIRNYGLSAAPFKQPTLKVVLGVVASYTSVTAWLDVQTAVNSFRAQWRAVAMSGVSGQVDTLTLRDADGVTNRTCQAELTDFPLDVVGGKNSRHVMLTLTFTLLSEFA